MKLRKKLSDTTVYKHRFLITISLILFCIIEIFLLPASIIPDDLSQVYTLFIIGSFTMTIALIIMLFTQLNSQRSTRATGLIMVLIITFLSFLLGIFVGGFSCIDMCYHKDLLDYAWYFTIVAPLCSLLLYRY